VTKFHENIHNLSENTAKSFRGAPLFLTHTVYVACDTGCRFNYELRDAIHTGNGNLVYENSMGMGTTKSPQALTLSWQHSYMSKKSYEASKPC